MLRLGIALGRAHGHRPCSDADGEEASSSPTFATCGAAEGGDVGDEAPSTTPIDAEIPSGVAAEGGGVGVGPPLTTACVAETSSSCAVEDEQHAAYGYRVQHRRVAPHRL